MRVNLDPSQQVSSKFILAHSPVDKTSFDEALYKTTLTSVKKSSVSEYFWKSWEYVKTTALRVWNWILWVFKMCPSDASRLDLMEHIVEEPKEAAKEFANNPSEYVGELIAEALLNPQGVRKLHEDHKGKFGEFARELKKDLKEKTLVPKTQELLAAIEAMYDFTKENKTKVFKDLFGFFKSNMGILGEALADVCEKVKDSLLVTTENPHVLHLQKVFVEYLPEVAAKIKEKPENFKEFLEELYKLKAFDEGLIKNLVQKHFTPAPDAEQLTAITACLKDNAVLIKALKKPSTLEEGLDDKGAIDVQSAFYSSVLAHLSSEHIEEFIKICGDYPLAKDVLSNLKDLNADQFQKIGDNLKESLAILRDLHGLFLNPPAPVK